MGGGRWTSTDWDSYSTTKVAGKSTAEVFTSRNMKPDYDPAKITLRESRDSADNPNSTPIFIACDVTGSMQMIADTIMREGLNLIATEIYNRKPVSDPHIMLGATGDTFYDDAPLQVTQFEADIRVAEQAAELWIERGGGGNSGESYLIAPLFAAMKVSADAIEKRGRKGYIFTIGDEPVLDGMSKAHAKRFLGLDLERDLTGVDIVNMVSRNFEYYHIVLVNEGACRHRKGDVLESWNKILPQRVIQLTDIKALAETIVSLIQVNEGAYAADVAKSWTGSTAVAVATAIAGLPARPGAGGIVRL